MKKEYEFKYKRYVHFDKRLKRVPKYLIIGDSSNKNNIDKKNTVLINKLNNHAFYPFIFDEIQISKIDSVKKNGSLGKISMKNKERPISYCSHIDNIIYQYYNEILSINYEKYLKEKEIDDVVIAYRKIPISEGKKGGKSNIHFAKDAFDFIKGNEGALIFVGDFKGFYDHLYHNKLKENVKKVMGDKISDGLYKVLKSVTKYTAWQMDSLIKISNVENKLIEKNKNKEIKKYEGSKELFSEKYKKDVTEKHNNISKREEKPSDYYSKNYLKEVLSKKDRVIELDEFKQYKRVFIKKFRQEFKDAYEKEKNKYMKENKKNECELEITDNEKIKFNTFKQFPMFVNDRKEHPYGIPQGSPISAMLSNVYMIDFDKEIKKYVDDLKGKYMRYSDDFIIILPINDDDIDNLYKELHDKVENMVKNYCGLFIEMNKSKFYKFSTDEETNEKQIYEIVKENEILTYKKSSLDYLGFKFTGKRVYLRDSTISRYYIKLNKKLGTINKRGGLTNKGNLITNKEIYNTYSQKGTSERIRKNKLKNKENASPREKYGNFISYVQRAEAVFGKDEKVNLVLKKHMRYIKNKRKKYNRVCTEEV